MMTKKVKFLRGPLKHDREIWMGLQAGLPICGFSICDFSNLRFYFWYPNLLICFNKTSNLRVFWPFLLRPPNLRFTPICGFWVGYINRRLAGPPVTWTPDLPVCMIGLRHLARPQKILCFRSLLVCISRIFTNTKLHLAWFQSSITCFWRIFQVDIHFVQQKSRFRYGILVLKIPEIT